MSRSQENSVFNQQQQTAQTNESNAQKSESAAQQDINSNQSQLAKFAANNPYMQGGEFQTAQGQTIANAANASSDAAKAGMQNLAARTGQNPQAAIAAGEATAQAAQRTAAGEQGAATTQRLGSEAAYNQQAQQDAADITGQQQNLAALQSGAAANAANTQETAAKEPSFLDELGNGLIQGGQMAGKAAVTSAMA